MDFPLSSFYLLFSLFTTIAFLYLIYNFFIINYSKYSLQTSTTSQIDEFNPNIQGVFSNVQIQKPASISQKINQICLLFNHKSKQNYCKQLVQYRKKYFKRQYIYLPNSQLGLQEMKALNRNYIKNNQNQDSIGLVKQKKKKNLSNYVKKYGFHKTTLVTIYQLLQY